MTKEEVIKRGEENMKSEIDLAMRITTEELRVHQSEADRLKNEYTKLMYDTYQLVLSYFDSDLSDISQRIYINPKMDRYELLFRIILEDSRNFMLIRRNYNLGETRGFDEINYYQTDYIAYAHNYNTNYNLMKLIVWYFQNGYSNNINTKDFSKIIYDYASGITAFRNHLGNNRFKMPIKNDLLEKKDKNALLRIIEKQLTESISQISNQILEVVILGSNNWDIKFEKTNNYLLYITLYTANMINMIKEYEISVDINEFINTIANKCNEKIKEGQFSTILAGVPTAIRKGIKVSEDYNTSRGRNKITM